MAELRLSGLRTNGSGIEKAQIRKAFLRHATSKIRGVEDLSRIHSLGFRGEALSSICAVSMVELITRTKDSLVGVRYCIEGEREADFSEIGAPEGTTILVRDLFYNTPARKKFLKTPATEGGYIADLMEHMALSRPDISFTFQINRQTRFSTSGSGDLKEVIYRIYGREIAKEIFPFEAFGNGFSVKGFLGSPQLVRPNRNFEFFFVNNRYIKSQVLSKGLESGYQAYLMQHKFPMAYLHLQIDTNQVDVNVHPSKMEVRFSDNRRVFDFLEEQVQKALHDWEMIRRLYWMTTKGRKKAVRRHLSKLPSVSHKSSFPPAFRLDIASRSVRMSRQQHRCRIRQSSDRPIWSIYTKADLSGQQPQAAKV